MEDEVEAYFYESRIVDGPGAGDGWSNQLRASNPSSIGNIEYRNVQRLVSADAVDVDAEPVGFKFVMESMSDGVSESVTRQDVRGVERDDVIDVQPLVPHPDDIDEGPELEPLRRRGAAEYFADSRDGEERYYRVIVDEDRVEATVDGDEVVEERMYNMWQYDRTGRIEPVSYDETPFAEPKY